MPDWLIAVVAVALIVWLVERVVPGAWRAWLTGSGLPIRTLAPRRQVSRQRTLATWLAVVLVALVLVWLLYYVFSQTSPA
jgi:hypothetical protein